ncbi:MAG: D-alanyl-D-alanine carboxypeptidase [Gammaproteobacteria bacterium]|nr:D-alanyl-D-alanine carboxypeptidase [Gammaproteobacteria bacterium]
MKSSLRRFCSQLTAVSILSLSWGIANAVVATSPKLDAKAYILMDFNSTNIIAELDSKRTVEPASLTKMMAAYIAFHELEAGKIRAEDQVVISKNAWKMQGSRMFLALDSSVTVNELLHGMIIQSGNDATVALAEHIAGSEESFVSLMNHYAKKLGMNSTHYMNATGLPHKEHYSTAYDLALLARSIIAEFPQHYSLYSEKEYTYNGIRQYNRNKLLWQDKYVDGIKTGHTDSAGYCLASSAKRGDMRLISVVLGTDSENARATESQKLLTYGFRFFESHKLYSAGQVLTKSRIWKGDADDIALGLSKDMYVTIPRGQYKSLKAAMSVDKKIIAPAAKGRVYGNVTISLGNQKIADGQLIALKNVNEASFASSLVDEVFMFFE